MTIQPERGQLPDSYESSDRKDMRCLNHRRHRIILCVTGMKRVQHIHMLLISGVLSLVVLVNLFFSLSPSLSPFSSRLQAWWRVPSLNYEEDGNIKLGERKRLPFPRELLGTAYSSTGDFWCEEKESGLRIRVPLWNGPYELGFRREGKDGKWILPGWSSSSISPPPSPVDDKASRPMITSKEAGQYVIRGSDMNGTQKGRIGHDDNGDDNSSEDDFLLEWQGDFVGGIETEFVSSLTTGENGEGWISENGLKGVRNDCWGPCYPVYPRTHFSSSTSSTPAASGKLNWKEEIRNATALEYPPMPKKKSRNSNALEVLDGKCRPGFLIIGVGKCGTSSLYHYLTSHPRVAPARQKQIGYFTYYQHRGMEWYLSNFPTTRSFLSNGYLLTGEAFPGYLHYPQSAYDVSRILPGAKIILAVREPLARAYSTYNYNYINPALERLRKGKGIHSWGKSPKVSLPPAGMDDEYYLKHHVFSFEELVRAEFELLKVCLEPGGIAEELARKVHGPRGKVNVDKRRRAPSPSSSPSFASSSSQDSGEEDLPPLVDIEACYGRKLTAAIPRKQWEKLASSNPQKILDISNVHLAASLIGRSIYVLPFEWWLVHYDQRDIHVVCTEEMSLPKTMDRMTSFLGLPEFDYAEILAKGRFNVAGHEGYDVQTAQENLAKMGPRAMEGKGEMMIPLSKELREEVEGFLQPYTERFFRLVGKRCPW